jgi:putative DNA primase/helicase
MAKENPLDVLRKEAEREIEGSAENTACENGWYSTQTAKNGETLAPDEKTSQNGNIEGAEVSSFSERKIITLSAADVQPRPVEWLIKGWLPLGKLTILAGVAGAGKTTLALKLAAMATAGGMLPDGATCAGGGNVLIWSGEDDVGDVLTPRLIASGAARLRCCFVEGTAINGKRCAFDPSRDIPLLDAKVKELGGLSMLILDPVVSAVHGDMHKANETRQGLQPVVEFATRHHCAVLGITHYAKASAGKSPADRVIGSQAFAAVARMVLGVAINEKEGTRTLFRAKTNISQSDGGLSYSLEQTTVEGNIPATYAKFEGVVEGTAQEILAEAESVEDDEGGALHDEKAFLLDLLKDGALPAKEIFRLAKEEGFSESSIKRAKANLRIKTVKKSMTGGWRWSLENSEGCQQNTKSVKDKTLNPFANFEPLRGNKAASNVAGMLGEEVL